MFCEKCGKEIKDGDKFCPYCGAENKINKDNNSIPNGIDNLNKLLKVIEKKGDINETYKTITNTA